MRLSAVSRLYQLRPLSASISQVMLTAQRAPVVLVFGKNLSFIAGPAESHGVADAQMLRKVWIRAADHELLSEGADDIAGVMPEERAVDNHAVDDVLGGLAGGEEPDALGADGDEGIMRRSPPAAFSRRLSAAHDTILEAHPRIASIRPAIGAAQ